MSASFLEAPIAASLSGRLLILQFHGPEITAKASFQHMPIAYGELIGCRMIYTFHKFLLQQDGRDVILPHTAREANVTVRP